MIKAIEDLGLPIDYLTKTDEHLDFQKNDGLQTRFSSGAWILRPPKRVLPKKEESLKVCSKFMAL